MPTTKAQDIVSICKWSEIADRAPLVRQIDEIFFESSGTKSFRSEAHRNEFRERWLGRYLENEPGWAYLALDRDGAVAGYLVGSVTDPATTGPFDDIGAFDGMAELTRAYPAHLHVNLDPRFRNQGIGSLLIDAFTRDAAQAGAKGVHVVTGAGARNVRFYERNGFRERARGQIRGHAVVFLARTTQTQAE